MNETLKAPNGYIYTDGVTYGKQIHLADGVDATKFYTITEEEYNALMESSYAIDENY